MYFVKSSRTSGNVQVRTGIFSVHVTVQFSYVSFTLKMVHLRSRCTHSLREVAVLYFFGLCQNVSVFSVMIATVTCENVIYATPSAATGPECMWRAHMCFLINYDRVRMLHLDAKLVYIGITGRVDYYHVSFNYLNSRQVYKCIIQVLLYRNINFAYNIFIS